MSEQSLSSESFKVFSFAGRLGRVRYAAWTGVLSFAAILAYLPLATLGKENDPLIVVLTLILIVPFLVGSFGITIRRIHDFNQTGWLALIFLIPIIGSIFQLVLVFIPGTREPNRFGPPPPPNRTSTWLAALLFPGIFFIGILAAILPAYNDYIENANAARVHMHATSGKDWINQRMIKAVQQNALETLPSSTSEWVSYLNEVSRSAGSTEPSFISADQYTNANGARPMVAVQADGLVQDGSLQVGLWWQLTADTEMKEAHVFLADFLTPHQDSPTELESAPPEE